MSVATWEADYDTVELMGIPALFTNCRLDRATIPMGWYVYEVMGSDDDFGSLTELKKSVFVNHSGTILTRRPIVFPKGQCSINIEEMLNFIDSRDGRALLSKLKADCKKIRGGM